MKLDFEMGLWALQSSEKKFLLLSGVRGATWRDTPTEDILENTAGDILEDRLSCFVLLFSFGDLRTFSNSFIWMLKLDLGHAMSFESKNSNALWGQSDGVAVIQFFSLPFLSLLSLFSLLFFSHLCTWLLEKPGMYNQSYGFSSSHVWMWELDQKQGWVLKNWCFQTMVLEKSLRRLLDCKGIKPVNPKGNQPWIFIGWTDAEAPIFWLSDVKSCLIGKDPDAGKHRGQEEKGLTEDKMVGWRHRLNGHEFEQAPGDGEEQGSLACCGPWGCKELDKTEQLKNNWKNNSFDYMDLCWQTIIVHNKKTTNFINM